MVKFSVAQFLFTLLLGCIAVFDSPVYDDLFKIFQEEAYIKAKRLWSYFERLGLRYHLVASFSKRLCCTGLTRRNRMRPNLVILRVCDDESNGLSYTIAECFRHRQRRCFERCLRGEADASRDEGKVVASPSVRPSRNQARILGRSCRRARDACMFGIKSVSACPWLNAASAWT